MSPEGFVFDVLCIERNLRTIGPVADQRDAITAKGPVEGAKLWGRTPFLEAERRELCVTGLAPAYQRNRNGGGDDTQNLRRGLHGRNQGSQENRNENREKRFPHDGTFQVERTDAVKGPPVGSDEQQNGLMAP